MVTADRISRTYTQAVAQVWRRAGISLIHDEFGLKERATSFYSLLFSARFFSERNFRLFPELKKNLRGKRFNSIKEIKSAVQTYFKSIPQEEVEKYFLSSGENDWNFVSKMKANTLKRSMMLTHRGRALTLQISVSFIVNFFQ